MGTPEPQHCRLPSRLERLQMAFAVRVARDIVDADGVLDMAEIEHLIGVFPTSVMQRAGFVDGRTQLTPEIDRCYDLALRELPGVLTLAEKLDLITLFHNTCLADGHVHPLELAVLRRAARQLGIPPEQLDEHLHRLKGGGTLVPPSRIRRPRA